MRLGNKVGLLTALLFVLLLLGGCGEPNPYFLIDGKDELKGLRLNNHVVLLKQQKMSLKLRYIGDAGAGGAFTTVTSGDSKIAKVVSSNNGLLVLQAGDDAGLSILSYSIPALPEIKTLSVHVSDQLKSEDLMGEWREKARLPFRCKGKEVYRITTRQFEMHCLYTIFKFKNDGTFQVHWVQDVEPVEPAPMMTYTGKWSLQDQYITLDDPAGVDGSARKSIGQLLWKDGKLSLFHYLHTMDGEFSEFLKKKEPKKD